MVNNLDKTRVTIIITIASISKVYLLLTREGEAGTGVVALAKSGLPMSTGSHRRFVGASIVEIERSRVESMLGAGR